MQYRMYDKGVPAGENAVELIRKHLVESGQAKLTKLQLDYVGFEGTAGTKFTLNNQKDKMAIPKCGYFITPIMGDSYMPIFSLVFDTTFTGNIYYIV